MADDKMPPWPECEFDFDLPHGVDTEEEQFDHDKRQPVHKAMDLTGNENRDDSIQDVSRSDQELDTLFADAEDNSELPLNYDRFPKGFSDDGSRNDTLECSWEGVQTKKLSSKKSKKSPRRSGISDSDEQASPKAKKPCKSLFGDAGQEVKEQDQEDDVKHQSRIAKLFNTTQPDIQDRMSSLDLDQQEAQDMRVPILSRGLGSSDVESGSPASSRSPSEESVGIPVDDKSTYELRPHIDRRKTYTYLDTDRTGNYDPAQEAKLKALRAQRAKAARSTKKKGKGRAKEKAPKEHIPKCIARLYLKGFGNVRNITNDYENWPKNWSDIGSDDEEAQREYRNYYRRNTPGREPQIGINDPSGKVEDMTGLPAARGCGQCRVDGKVCSMTDGGTFPCEECGYGDHRCEPICALAMKRRCKQCVDNSQERCSFQEDPDQAVCDECMAGGQACELLPPQGYRTPRICIDKILYGPNRRHTACTSCRREKKRCSLKKKTDKPPCVHCKKNNTGCTFYDLPKIFAEKKVSAKKRPTLGPTDGVAPEVSQPGSKFFSREDLEDMEHSDEEYMPREPTPEIEMEDNAGNKGMLTKINTCFAHPIAFNVDKNKYDDCNFCEMPMFGFVGHFEREVHVIRWYSGHGFTELGGGHRELNGATAMCTECTNTRLSIIFCQGHEIERDTDAFVDEDFTTVATELMDSPPGSEEMRNQLQRWCSMCSSVATHGCTKVQPALIGDDESDVTGCGLKLCDRCVATLRDDHHWDLPAMLEDMVLRPKANEEDEETGELEMKPRADVEFLRKEGLLTRSLIAASEDNIEE